MRYTARGWIESHYIPEARTDIGADQVELAWLTRYSLPNIITLHGGKQLLVEFAFMMTNYYRILCSPISARNP